MQVIPPWLGAREEWRLLREAWRALPDNPLWLLARHTHRNAAPRVARRRSSNFVLGWMVVGGLYLLSLGAVGGVSGQLEAGAVLSITMGFAVALAGLTLLACVLNLSNRAQVWLGRERGDAKHTSLARMDPLLSLSLLTPRDIVVAALRELLPTALLGTAAACVAGFALLVTMVGWELQWSNDPDKLYLVLAMAPVTVGSVALAGIGGGIVLTLLSFCVGLNSGSSLQRSILALMLTFHQFIGTLGSLAYWLVPEINDVFRPPLIPVIFGVVYLLAAAAFGVHLATSVRGASAGWLLITPMVAVFGFGLCIGVAAIASMGFGDTGMDLLGPLGVQLASLWFSINLFVPGCIPTLLCIGETGYDYYYGQMELNFLAVMALLAVLLPMAYRAALACAALRLRGTE